MFDKIKEKLDQAGKKYSEQISQFDDEIPKKKEWCPFKSGVQNYKSHSLQEINLNRIEFKPSLGSFLFSGIFMIIVAYLIYIGITGLSVSLTKIFETNE